MNKHERKAAREVKHHPPLDGEGIEELIEAAVSDDPYLKGIVQSLEEPKEEGKEE